MILDVNMRLIMVIWCLFFQYQVFACASIPQYYSRPYSEVISDSKTIYLAKVKSKTEINVKNDAYSNLEELIDNASNNSVNNMRYEFEIIEYIKGYKPSKFFYKLGLQASNDNNGDFNGHTDYKFWLDNGGRVKASPDCAIRPNFIVGKVYLIIENTHDSYKSYEEINLNNDAWLSEVRMRLKIQKN